MLSDKSTVCPNNLLDLAHQKKGIKVAIANAGKTLPMISVMDAVCLLYTSPSPRDATLSRMPSSA